MGRCHPRSGVIVDQARKQAYLGHAGTGRTVEPVGREPALNLVPERFIDDWRVFAGIAVLFVNDFAAVDAVLQHEIESAAGQQPTTSLAVVLVDPHFAYDPAAVELLLEGEDGAECGVAPVDVADRLCLALVTTSSCPSRVEARGRAAHPTPFFFDAAILSRMRSPVTSRSNWAKTAAC
jgi:hypothetical protein